MGNIKYKKDQIKTQSKEIYEAIIKMMELQGVDYCQSWWINTRNFELKQVLTTRQINYRAKLLVRDGYLTIDKDKTSTSMGTSYRLTDLKLN